MTDINRYLDFVMTLFFAFGVAFEVPVATVILALLGILTPEAMAAKRPYVIVGAFIVGMLLTPPDVISQTLLALPMWFLFEIGVFVARLLLRSRTRALVFNLLSSLATLVGGILAYFALSQMESLVPVFLGLAAASMIYVAVADLIPGLHKRTELRATAQQVLLIAAGIASIVFAHPLAERALG